MAGTGRDAVLVTGAGGFVGRAIVARLREAGRRVIAAGRSLESLPDGVERLDLPLPPPQAPWRDALGGIDAIVHCAARAHVLREQESDPLAAFRAVNRDMTLALARAAAEAGVRRFVFLSSIGVLGDRTDGRPFTADSPVRPHSPYAVAKAEAEEGLRALAATSGLEVVIVRPPLVIGRGAKGNLGLLVRAMRKGLPLPLGLVRRNRRDLVSLDTLADLVLTCLDHPRAAGQTFLVADGRPLSTREVIERLARLEGAKPRLLPVPPALLGAGLRLIGRGGLAAQLLGDLEVDIAASRDRLGWAPPAGHES